MSTAVLSKDAKHTLSVLVKHNLNTFSRIIGIFSGKGFELDSVTFASEAEPGMARITITTHGDEKTVEQINKHLHNVVDVLKVTDLTHRKCIERELAIIKVSTAKAGRSEIMLIAQAFKSKVIDITNDKLALEVTGNTDKVDAMIQVLRPYGITEMSRTGSVALKREFQGPININ
ncbi:MAG: acetolactate synthase small subunit [Balneolaceae bacterium]|nr:acetolactate synthase small subunit [Balneolaceae bacterium]